jgi:hypothetical protein
MEFFFPDSQDYVSPFFDFETEEQPVHRIRQRDDKYAHEILSKVPYDGILISKAIVDGSVRGAGNYTSAQRQRIFRLGAHRYFRAVTEKGRLPIMGDCGAFTYAAEPEPPYSVQEVVDFYQSLGLDRGISVDHIIFGFISEEKKMKGIQPDPDWLVRRELTIQLAADFLREVKARGRPFEPIGVAHGWDLASYQLSVKELQDIGYSRISMGGMVPLKTEDILSVLGAVSDIRDRSTRLHLLGVTRTESMSKFSKFGVSSFDSTSPFRQAFMDAHDNYYVLDRTYIALRVPQVSGNANLKKRILAGHIDHQEVRKIEKQCLDLLRRFDRGAAEVDEVVNALHTYELIYDTRGIDRSALCREVLEDAPWKNCKCGICQTVGIDVMLFRGSERNKRRGFHNLAVFRKRLEAAGVSHRQYKKNR